MAKAKQPVSIDGIEFDALIDESLDYEAEVPEYPTENGFNVSDNISLKPGNLTMTLFVTDTPVTWFNRHGAGLGRTEAIVKKLKDLYFSKKVVEVVTSDEVFTNMAITDISFSKSADVGYAREIPITLKKIVITETATATIPESYGKSGATAASTGTASTTKASVTKTTATASSVTKSGSGQTSSTTKSSSSATKSSSASSSSGTKKSSILYSAASKAGLV